MLRSLPLRVLLPVVTVFALLVGCHRERIIKEELPSPKQPPQFALGAGHSCMLRDGRVTCWGSWRALPIGADTRGQPREPTVVPGLSEVTELRAQRNRTCALQKDRRVICWGYPLVAEPETVEPPKQVPGLNDAVALFSVDPLCVRHLDGRVTCQVKEQRLEFPRDSKPSVAQKADWCVLDPAGVVTCRTSSRKEEKKVALPGKAKSLSSSRESSCAIVESGQVYCWGLSAAVGFWGKSPCSEEEPLHIPLGHRATAVAVGAQRRCALLETGEVDCWGVKLVAERDHESVMGPTTLPASGKVEAIGVGKAHLCVATVGAIYCAGNNDQGQLGQGQRSAASGSFVEVSLDKPAAKQPFQRVPDCAKLGECRPQCAACPWESLCAMDGTCRPVERVEVKRKQKNGVVSWQTLKWGDPEREKALNTVILDGIKQLIEDGSDAKEHEASCHISYLSEKAANLVCSQSVYYEGGAHGLTAVMTTPLDLRGTTPRSLRYGEVITTRVCRQGVEAYAIDSLLDQDAMWIVDGSVREPNHDFGLSREGLRFGYPLYSVQPYMGGMASVQIPCTVLRAVGCVGPWIDDMCR